jgi:hypothetical protein
MPEKPFFLFCEFKFHVKQGDFLLSSSKFKLTTLLIPGPVDHCAIAVSKDEVVEMVGTGWRKITLKQFWDESSSQAVLRLKPWDEAYARAIADKALSLKNTPYDIHFNLGIEALYCSELCLVCDTENRAQFNLADIRGLGRKYLSPTGVYNAKGCEVVYDTH